MSAEKTIRAEPDGIFVRDNRRALETELHAGLEAEITLTVVAVREVVAEPSQLIIGVH